MYSTYQHVLWVFQREKEREEAASLFLAIMSFFVKRINEKNHESTFFVPGRHVEYDNRLDVASGMPCGVAEGGDCLFWAVSPAQVTYFDSRRSRAHLRYLSK